MAATPQFTATVRSENVEVSAANALRTGAGTIVQGFVGGTSGTRIERIRVKAQGTTTTGQVRIFTWDGSVYHLMDEVLVTAITPNGTTTASFKADLAYGNATPLFIPSGEALGFSTVNAEVFEITIIGGDF